MAPRTRASLKIDELPDLLTVREVAEVLRVSPLTIKRWGKKGKLPAIRINSRGDRRYKKEAVLWLLGIAERSRVIFEFLASLMVQYTSYVGRIAAFPGAW